jgi:hypothetical protein
MKALKIGIALLILFLRTQAQNYKESAVPPYTLPDPLISLQNKKINSIRDWERQRRGEILSLFEENEYGRMPQDFDSLRYTTTREDKEAMDGKAHLKEEAIMVWRSGRSVKINLVLFTPNKRKKPVPVFLLINIQRADYTDPTRKIKSGFWPAEMIIDSGYAIAAFQINDAAPDNKEHYTEGVLQLYPNQITAPDGMKAVGCWAWAASRIMDYFEKNAAIDARRVFLVGHSRGGKAALWAGAQDKRFAMIFSNCSGNSGAALSRRRFGETIKAINTRFPYWFCDNYKKYNDNVDALPVDQHLLIALIAPRPLYTTNATEDLWADPKGSFLSLKHAEPVYALYKERSALGNEPPPPNSPIIHSILGYHVREGKHDLTAYDWEQFVKFAEYHLRRYK